MKTQLIRGIFEMYFIQKKNCQKQYMHRGKSQGRNKNQEIVNKHSLHSVGKETTNARKQKILTCCLKKSQLSHLKEKNR